MRPCLNLTTIFQADLETGISAASEAGFQTVELWVESLERYLETHTVDDLRGLLEKNGVQVAGIGDIESVTFCEAERKQELHRRCEKLAEVACAISCPTLVVSASVRPRGADDNSIAEEAVSALGGLLDVVEPAGVGLALAFRGFMWCAVNTLEIARETVAAHRGRRVGLVLDTFDLHATGAGPDAFRIVDQADISVMRLCDCESVPAAIRTETARTLPGEGAAELDAMIEAAAGAGYCGPVSLKIPSSKLMGLDADEAAKVVMAIADQYLSGASAEKQA